jgi:hypothetical protein
MTGASVSFTLDGGEILHIARDDLRHVCNLLWGLAPKPGALAMAAMVHAASRQAGLLRCPFDLTLPQSHVLREAVDLLLVRPGEA